MANIFNINNKNILATASITITDQTDAATLAGGISVVSGSKNQVYLTGSSSPLSPDWSKNNLVLRPYLYASTITRYGAIGEYNPDLFDPNEYPNLNNPGDNNVSTAYINKDDLFWYVRDANGTETLIDPTDNSNFSYSYMHNNTIYEDKRYLVIKNNFIPRNSFVSIICRFSFYDPFAKIFVKQSYEIDLSCLSTGQGTSQLILQSVNGTSIYNSSPSYIDLYATFFKDGVEVDVQQEIESTEKNSRLFWYIRSASGNGWTLLDGTKQNNNNYDFSNMFEVRRYTSHDKIYNVYATEETTSTRGGFYLRLHPAIINGSSVIKAVLTSSDDNRDYSALEVVYDATDEVQAYIHSSNGDKIYQGIDSVGTTLTCMIKYQGALLSSDDSKYETDFEYYWFKISSDGTQTWNVYLDNTGKLQYKELTADNNGNLELVSSSRILPIKANDVDNVNMFQCAIIDKVNMANVTRRADIITNSPSEDDIIMASLLNAEIGIEDENDELLNTAYEINAFNIANGTSLTD
jgi:hypothetical protein